MTANLIGFCIAYLLKSTSKSRNCYNINISQKSELNLNVKNQHAVITYANTSFDKTISIFLKKNWGMMLNLSSAPLIFLLNK